MQLCGTKQTRKYLKTFHIETNRSVGTRSTCQKHSGACTWTNNTVTPEEGETTVQSSLELFAGKKRHKKVSKCIRTRLVRGRVPLATSQLSSTWCCCRTPASRAPAAFPATCATAGVGGWPRQARSPLWAPCRPPGRSPRSAAAAGRWWGRAGRPSCGKCAAAGTSSSGPGTGRLSGGGETGHVRVIGGCVVVLCSLWRRCTFWLWMKRKVLTCFLFTPPTKLTKPFLIPQTNGDTTKLHFQFI